MMHEHNYNGYIHQQEIIEAWQKHEYIKELYAALKFELLKINWIKFNYIALNKYSFANKTTYLKEFNKHIEEINNIIRKLKIVNAYAEIQRAENIKQLTNKLIKQIK